MTIPNIEKSPELYARIGGVAYLLIIITGGYDEMFIRNAAIVSGNAEATMHNILASSLKWRIGIALDLVQHVGDVVLMMCLYLLLRPVNKNLALFAMLFSLIQTAVLIANKLNLFMPLFLSGDADYLKAFNAEQLETLSYIAVKAHGYGFGVGLIFFSFDCLVNGYLIYRSRYMPKFIGILIQVAGLCYLANSLLLIVAPAFEGKLFPLILVPPFIGEFSLCLWLLIKGVNRNEWNSRIGLKTSS